MFNFSLENIIATVISIAAFLISVSCHEFSHGYVAYKLGDPTAKNSGRLTLNPLKHFDLLSVLFYMVFHFGWAKGVPINPAYFKDTKKGMVMSALAGPLTNILLAFISAVILQIYPERVSFGGIGYHILLYLYQFLYYMLSVNVMLAIFNLIPIPPLDGSKVFFSVFPERIYYRILSYDRFMLLLLLVLVYTGVLDRVITTGAGNLTRIIMQLADMAVFFK